MWTGVVAGLVLFQVAWGAPAADEILSLPGWAGALPTRQYSGYLSIPESGSNLHYWLVTAEKSPESAPTVLWLNGGPGCSSLDGFFYEMGPFVINSDNTLSERPIRWNTLANMIYLESPVGVGFSYSSASPPNYACSDDRTAQENMRALEILFSKKFPELAANRLFLSGESYSGIYTPTLAEAILNGLKDGSYKGPAVSGILVGNGCSGTEVGICGGGSQATYSEWSYLIQTPFVSQDLKTKINSACDWEAAKQGAQNALSYKCVSLLNQASDAIGPVNLYDVYGECTSGGCSGSVGERRGKVPMREPLIVEDPENPGTHRKLQRIIPGGPDACIDSTLASNYLNQPAVLEAIHVKVPDHCWSVCATAAGWTYNSTRTNLPRDTYPALIANMRVLIYNGDFDGQFCACFRGGLRLFASARDCLTA